MEHVCALTRVVCAHSHDSVVARGHERGAPTFVRWVLIICMSCLAQSAERKALNLMVMGSSPRVGFALA